MRPRTSEQRGQEPRRAAGLDFAPDALSPRTIVVGVGFDFSRGNAAIRTDLSVASLGDGPDGVRARLNAVADEIDSYKGRGRAGDRASAQCAAHESD
jgi:hypothetical protein